MVPGARLSGRKWVVGTYTWRKSVRVAANEGNKRDAFLAGEFSSVNVFPVVLNPNMAAYYFRFHLEVTKSWK